jgi:hypothetical protein
MNARLRIPFRSLAMMAMMGLATLALGSRLGTDKIAR